MSGQIGGLMEYDLPRPINDRLNGKRSRTFHAGSPGILPTWQQPGTPPDQAASPTRVPRQNDTWRYQGLIVDTAIAREKAPPQTFQAIAQIRVLLVSDSALARAWMANCLEGDPAMVGRMARRAEALKLVDATRLDIAVLDLAGLPMANLDLIRAFHNRNVPVIAVTSCTEVDQAMAVLTAGVSAYLLDVDRLPPILDAILNGVAGGEPMVDPQLAAALGPYVAGRAARTGRTLALSDLSPDDAALLSLLAQGLGNKEISQQLGLSVRGVEARVDRVLIMLNARNRTQAAAKAGWLGLTRASEIGEGRATTS
jgi:DNA-binding NarL/FixJ family response regulator